MAASTTSITNCTLKSASPPPRGRRADNQDYAAARFGRPRAGLAPRPVAAVADGVGGAKGGREAAELSVRGFLDGFFNLPGFAWRAAGRGPCAGSHQLLDRLAGPRRPELAGMATTFTALILSGRSGHYVHVGDSRLYRFREDSLEQLTEDHVMGRGDLKHMSAPRRGPGRRAAHGPCAFSLRALERYLLCSDGVHGDLRNARMRDILGRRAASAAARRRNWSPPRSTPAPTTIALRWSSTFSTRRRREPANCTIFSTICPSCRCPSRDRCSTISDRRAVSEGRYSRLMRAQDLRAASRS